MVINSHRVAGGPADLEAGQRRAAVFLDRDGTLNVERGYLNRPTDIELLPGVASALCRLRDAGFLLIVVTNQSIIARGLAIEAMVDEVNRQLLSELGKSGAGVDAVYVCPHHPNPESGQARADLAFVCDCRKPAIGLLARACRDFHIDLSRSWMIGDHTRDIETARRAGLRSVLVKTGHAGLDGEFTTTPDHLVDDLSAAAVLIEAAMRSAGSALP